MQDYEQISNEIATISQRLQQVASAHEACLSNLTSLTVAADSAVSSPSTQKITHKNQNDFLGPLAKDRAKKRGEHQVNGINNGKSSQGNGIGPVALQRSMCTSLDGGGAASSAFSPDGSAVSTINLGPSERVVPSRIVPGIETPSSIEKKVVRPFTERCEIFMTLSVFCRFFAFEIFSIIACHFHQSNTSVVTGNIAAYGREQPVCI